MLQCFCCENTMNSMKRSKDVTPEDDSPQVIYYIFMFFFTSLTTNLVRTLYIMYIHTHTHTHTHTNMVFITLFSTNL